MEFPNIWSTFLAVGFIGQETETALLQTRLPADSTIPNVQTIVS